MYSLSSSSETNEIGCAPYCSKFDILKSSLNITKKLFPNIDILIFHEDYTEEDMKRLPPIKEYIKIDFSGKETLYSPENRHRYGYLMMCRFFAGGMQNHPILQNYSHYMRLDDDSYFMEPFLTSDSLSNMTQYDYTFRSLFFDKKDQQSLYEFTCTFLKQNKCDVRAIIPMLVNNGFLEKHKFSVMHLHESDIYTGLAPYNNFHVSSIGLWKHPLVQKYIQSIEDTNNILKHGWLDANIHAMIIFMIAPFAKLNIRLDMSFGYRHNKHVSLMNTSAITWDESYPFHPEIDL